jgi:hypothetical protein
VIFVPVSHSHSIHLILRLLRTLLPTLRRYFISGRGPTDGRGAQNIGRTRTEIVGQKSVCTCPSYSVKRFSDSCRSTTICTMGFWRSKSRHSLTASFSSNASKPSTANNIDKAHKKEMPTKAVPQQSAPLLSLPVELIQHIASYLDLSSSAASFSLSSRYICYAIGRQHLATFLSNPSSRFQQRKNIEVLERAFPSHWYCAWCDTFHRHDIDGGPTKYGNEMKRDCAEFNSYVHDGFEYVICYHHVRLALNRVLWGKEYGIGVDAFANDETVTRKLGKISLDTRLKCEAKVVEGRLILHASYHVTTPPLRSLRARDLIPVLPQVAVGHRDSHAPHSGLYRCLDNALMSGTKSGVQLCSVCATDFEISCHTDSDSWQGRTFSPEPSKLFLNIRTWRDLGNGRNPFDASWRAHGELGKGREGFASDTIRLASLQSGDIKKAFKGDKLRSAIAGVTLGMERPDGKSLEDSMSESWTQEIIRSREKRVLANQELNLGLQYVGGGRRLNELFP